MYIGFIIICLFVPPLGIPLGLIGILFDFKHWKAYVLCLSISFSIAGYCYNTLGNSDITRYIPLIEEIGSIPLRKVFEYGKYGTEGERLYLFNIVCWIAGKLNDPHLVPAFSLFFIYNFTFKIICKIGEELKTSKSSIMFCMIFAIMGLNFYSLVNNIRNVLAFVMIGYATFRDLFCKKKDILTIILYIFPVFLHSSSLIILALRIVLSFASKIRIIATFLIILIQPILDLLLPVAYSLSEGSFSIISTMIFKAYNYFNDTSSAWGIEVQTSGAAKAYKILYVSILVIGCTILFFSLHKKDKKANLICSKNEIGLHSFMDFTFYIGLMGIACVPMITPEYWRFSATLVSFCGCIFLPYEIRVKDKTRKIIVWSILLFISFLSMILWLRNIYLGGMMEESFIKQFYSSPLLIFLSDITCLV